MRLYVKKTHWFCRWDGKQYTPENPDERDGFCCPACKQALYRAVKKSNDWKNGKRGKRGKYKKREKQALPEKQDQAKLRKNKRNAKKAKKKRRK